MGILKELHNGKWRYGVSRRLPQNALGVKRFRRWYPNRATARQVLDRLNGAIANGTIDQVLPALLGKGERDYTLGEFWPRFLAEYCKPRMSSWGRYQQSMGFILADLGNIGIRQFHRRDLHDWLERRVQTVTQSTANKDIAALKKMFSYALEVGAVDSNPISRFRAFRVQERNLRIPTLEEFHALVDAMPTPELRALVAVLGETGLRKSEALGLLWEHLDLRGRRLVVTHSKGKRVRTVPLSDYAIEHLGGLVRFIKDRHVFCYQTGHLAGQVMQKPYKSFRVAARAAGLAWVTFHTLRHFRATTWLHEGVDLKTVKEKLGHKAIATTSRYLQYVESHAERAIREAQKREQIELEREKR